MEWKSPLPYLVFRSFCCGQLRVLRVSCQREASEAEVRVVLGALARARHGCAAVEAGSCHTGIPVSSDSISGFPLLQA